MTLADLLAGGTPAIRIRIVSAQGSAPRAAGTEMFVTTEAMHGSIGGGQLEFMALDRARQMLLRRESDAVMDVPLGPEIGQCCGGRVEIALARLDDTARADALARAETRAAARADVLILGAGHVGRGLARALAPLPLATRLIDSREAELERAGQVRKCLTPLPEAEIAKARPGAAYVVLTHDHALDFLLAGAALERGDAAYVGMIGSATKRAAFAAWSRRNTPGADPSTLVCPIGAAGLGDKRPAVIAAFVATEIMAALAGARTRRESMENNA